MTEKVREEWRFQRVGSTFVYITAEQRDKRCWGSFAAVIRLNWGLGRAWLWQPYCLNPQEISRGAATAAEFTASRWAWFCVCVWGGREQRLGLSMTPPPKGNLSLKGSHYSQAAEIRCAVNPSDPIYFGVGWHGASTPPNSFPGPPTSDSHALIHWLQWLTREEQQINYINWWCLLSGHFIFTSPFNHPDYIKKYIFIYIN